MHPMIPSHLHSTQQSHDSLPITFNSAMDFLTAHLRVDFDALRLVASVAALVVLYPVSLSIYRLTFNPLIKFSRLKIAAAIS